MIGSLGVIKWTAASPASGRIILPYHLRQHLDEVVLVLSCVRKDFPNYNSNESRFYYTHVLYKLKVLANDGEVFMINSILVDPYV